VSAPTTATLATTSEGLWLAAAKAGATWLPPVLRIRPLRSVADTLADHPGLPALSAAVVDNAGELRADVAEWMTVIGRPDQRPAELLGPPKLPSIDPGVVDGALGLAEWHSAQSAQRVIAVCRRGDKWVSVCRTWESSGFDQVIVTGTDEQSWPAMLGSRAAVRFTPINADLSTLTSAVAQWQTDPTLPNLMALTNIGLTVPQVRIVEAVCDAGTTRAAISVAQYDLDGHTRPASTVTVADTLLGRALIITAGDRISLLPGYDSSIHSSIHSLCETLGAGWRTHQRNAETPS
jgi:hypothetical protein